jgi:hypothetical protein
MQYSIHTYTGAEPGGREGESAPSQPTKFFLIADKIFLDTLIAHPKSTIRGIDITSGGKQQSTFYYFNLHIFFTVLDF